MPAELDTLDPLELKLPAAVGSLMCVCCVPVGVCVHCRGVCVPVGVRAPVGVCL